MNAHLAVAVALVVAGVTLDRCAPVIGAHSQIRREQAATAKERSRADQATKAARAWEQSYRQSEGLRVQETSAARLALTEAGRACEDRVKRARASGAAIRTIVTKEPRREPNGCPVRELVDPGRLRDAISPAG